MKQIISNYVFDKTAKTVTLTDFSTVNLSRLLLITNVTANVVVYQFNNPALGGAVSGNVLTLTYNTSAMSNADKLQIVYDTATNDPGYSFKLTRGFTAGTYQTVKTSAGSLGSIVVTNTSAALKYLLIINSASVPSGSTGLVASFPIPAGATTSPGYVMLGKDVLNGLYLSAGIQIAVSTSENTYTAATAGDHTLHSESI